MCSYLMAYQYASHSRIYSYFLIVQVHAHILRLTISSQVLPSACAFDSMRFCSFELPPFKPLTRLNTHSLTNKSSTICSDLNNTFNLLWRGREFVFSFSLCDSLVKSSHASCLNVSLLGPDFVGQHANYISVLRDLIVNIV